MVPFIVILAAIFLVLGGFFLLSNMLGGIAQQRSTKTDLEIAKSVRDGMSTFGNPRLGAMHVILDLLECEPQKLIGWKKWYVEIKQAVVRSGMTIATHHSTGAQCELGHDYPGEGSGYTYCVYVLESHVIVHTTPESSLVNVCVFFCDFREDNSAKAIAVANELAVLYGSKNPVETRVRRYS